MSLRRAGLDVQERILAAHLGEGASPLEACRAAQLGHDAANRAVQKPHIQRLIMETAQERIKRVRERVDLDAQITWAMKIREAAFLGAQFGPALNAHKYLDQMAGLAPDVITKSEIGRPGEFKEAQTREALIAQAQEQLDPKYFEAYRLMIEHIEASRGHAGPIIDAEPNPSDADGRDFAEPDESGAWGDDVADDGDSSDD